MPGRGSKHGRLVSFFKGKARETSGQTSGTQSREEAVEPIQTAAASPATDNVLAGSPRATQQSGSGSLAAALNSDLAQPVSGFIEDRNDLYGLKPLAGPTVDDAALDALSPDIIAVHGVDGNAWKTWEHSNGKLWLRDFLPKHVPGARIYSFGYPAEVAFTRGRGDLNGFARSLLEGLNSVRYNERLQARPIIFICHSMGGLVVKQAMITASLDRDDYGHIRDSTRGILFLSTPHRGSTAVPWPKLLSRIGNVALEYTKTSGWLGRSRTDLLTLLERDSPQLVDITLSFRNQHKGIKIISFYEGDATAPFKEPIVDVATGVLGFEGETVVPMDGCDHHTVCRFPSENNSYNLVLGHIRRISSGTLSSLDNNRKVSLKESVESRIHIPKAEFFGRVDELNELYRFLGPEVLARNGVVIWGLSGYGKTQLAMHYIDQFRPLYSSLLWIDASSKQSCEESFREIRYQLLGLNSQQTKLTSSGNLVALHGTAVSDVIHWLSQDTNKSWLMVFDSVDSREEIDIREYIPRCKHGKLIVTTTLSDLYSPLKFHGIELRGVDDLSGSKILLKSLESVTPSQSMQDAAESITRKLKGIPLAIEQAGAFLSFGIVSIHDYNRHFETKYREHTLKVPPRGYHCCYEKNRPICVALDMLLETLQGRSPHSVKLLKLSVFLGPGEILLSMIADAPLPRNKSNLELNQASMSTDSIPQSDIAAWLNRLRSDESSFGAAVQNLEQACLASFSRDRDCQIRNYVVHDIVRNWILGRLSEEETSEYAITAFALIGTLLFDQSGLCSPQAMQNHTVLLNTILKTVFSNISEEIIRVPDGKYASLYGSVASGFGKFCRLQGQLQKGKKLLNAANEYHVFSGEVWPSKREHLTELEEIAIIEWQLGNLDIAVDRYNSLLDQCSLILGGFDDMTVKIAISLRKLRERRITENQAAERAYNASRDVKTSQSISGQSISSEPVQYQHMDDAEWELREAYEEAKNLLGENDFETVKRAEKLAAYYQRYARPQQEEPVREYIWQYYSTNFIPTKPSPIRSLYELCKCYKETGKLRLELRGKLKLAQEWAKTSNFKPLQSLLREADASSFFAAALEGNLTTVFELLSQQMVDINETDSYNNTALHWAAIGGHNLVAQLLLQKGYDIKAKNINGETALHVAIIGWHRNLVSLLLEKGADIEATDKHGYTALCLAAGKGDAAAVLLLLEEGADAQAKSHGGWTSLHLAALNGNIEVVNRLVSFGVDPKEKANDGWTSLHLAAKKGHIAIANRLVELGVDPKEKSNDGWTSLHTAAKQGHIAMVNRLVELGVDPKEKSKLGWTSLHTAAEKGHIAMVNRLVELGADPKEKSMSGGTALHVSAFFGHIKTMKLLFNLGVVDVPDNIGFTALHLAIYVYKADVVRVLINAGGDFRSIDPYGYSPLEIMVRTPEIYLDLQSMLQMVESTAEVTRMAKRKSSIAKVIMLIRQFPVLRSTSVLSTLGRLLLFNGDESNARFAFARNARLENGGIRHCASCNLCGPEKELLGIRHICRQCADIDLCSSCMKTYGIDPVVPGCRGHEFLSIPQAEMKNHLTNIDLVQGPPLGEFLDQLWTLYGSHGEGESEPAN